MNLHMVVRVLLLVLVLPSTSRISSSEDGKSDSTVIETILAPATTAHQRNSEGDITVLKDGKLLAAWSDFYGGAKDDSAARISAVISSDGGPGTWSTPYTIQENTGKQNVMSVNFLRSRSGDLLFFYSIQNTPANMFPLVRRSRDEGRHWSSPVRLVEGAGYYILNNARAIQLHSGRIVCPISFDNAWTDDSHWRTIMYFSDDDGRTWKSGKQVVDVPQHGAMEPGLVEMNDGRLLQYIRTNLGRVWYSYSADGGDTWTEAQQWTLPSPETPTTVVRLPSSGAWIAIYNPTVKLGSRMEGPRTPLVAAVSIDEGKSWSSPKIIEGDPSAEYAYTSITIHGSRVLLSYYLSRQEMYSLKFKSIPASWFQK